MSKFHINCFKTIEVNVENLNTCIQNRFKNMHVFTLEILHIACTKIEENYTLQNLKFI